MPPSKLPTDGHVTIPQARLRVLEYLRAAERDWQPMSWLGRAIWPDSRMRAQGLALAASPIVRGLVTDGLVQWNCESVGRPGDRKSTRWGYSITGDGKRWLANNEGVA